MVTLSDAPFELSDRWLSDHGGSQLQNQIQDSALRQACPNVDQKFGLDTVEPGQAWGQNLGYTPEWDTVYQKLRFFTGGTEVANGVDLSGIVFSLCIIGT